MKKSQITNNNIQTNYPPANMAGRQYQMIKIPNKINNCVSNINDSYSLIL
ncbi:MAG: hypothetical protein GY858_02565 [Candidatus Omnitrophica bacterium]|nr:hypothetical protein [Candidatus Omnitrophota bacterium]